ncbi:MAG: HAMP domain-containing histidine kinase [Planctomycetaceae bacterium]|nr:HAMP domain-containing histidine kinase [Planctomycetaceae bacterium]
MMNRLNQGNNVSTPRGSTVRWVAKAAWLVRLRWVAVAGQLATIVVAVVALQVSLPIAPLLSIIGFTALTNLFLTLALRRMVASRQSRIVLLSGDTLLATIMAIDLLSLTGLLYFAGGATNPFSVFYLVNLALCAVILPERWGWSLMAVAVGSLAALLAFHVDVPELRRGAAEAQRASLGEWGQLVAMTTCALVIILFVKRVIHQLEKTQATLQRVELERSRSEKLQSLGTLAGGAAHELATPLSTIAVISNEMARHLRDDGATLAEDVALIRSEVDHCQTILARMTGRARQISGEEVTSLTVDELISTTLSELTSADQVRVLCSDEVSKLNLSVPRESLAQALRGLIQNGLDATAPESAVELSIVPAKEGVRMVVHDDGPGMIAETLSRAGEPFFTTKEPGRGMGLGLFLARSVIERLGGTLQLDSSPGRGVTAILELPSGLSAVGEA